MGQRIIVCANCKKKDFRLLLQIKHKNNPQNISSTHNVVICNYCGLIFLNPQYEEKDYADYYLNIESSKAYLNVNDVNKFIPKNPQSKLCIVKKFLLDNIEHSKHNRLLDVGCGKGVFLYMLKDYKFALEGLDPDKGAVEFAKQKFGLSVFRSTLLNNNLPKEHYDIVTAISVLEHVTDPIISLSAMRRLLKPGGHILISVPDYRGMALTKGVNNYFKFVHTYYYTDVTLSSLVQQAGFTVKKVKVVKPALKKTYFGGLIKKYKKGFLMIMAQKQEDRDIPGRVTPLRDNTEELIKILSKIKKRDFPYFLINKLHKL